MIEYNSTQSFPCCLGLGNYQGKMIREWSTQVREITSTNTFMKYCSRCDTTKDLSGFHRRGNGYQPICKSCRKLNDAKFYKDNKKRIIALKKKRRLEKLVWYFSLKQNPCVDCGVMFHPTAMQWDHRDKLDKILDVSAMLNLGKSKKLILKEIEKCDLRCANCHAVKSWKESTGCSSVWPE